MAARGPVGVPLTAARRRRTLWANEAAVRFYPERSLPSARPATRPAPEQRAALLRPRSVLHAVGAAGRRNGEIKRRTRPGGSPPLPATTAPRPSRPVGAAPRSPRPARPGSMPRTPSGPFSRGRPRSAPLRQLGAATRGPLPFDCGPKCHVSGDECAGGDEHLTSIKHHFFTAIFFFPGVSESICSARPPPPAAPGRFPPRLRSPPPEPRVPGARLAPPERCPRRDAGLIAAPLSARHRAAPLLRLVRFVSFSPFRSGGARGRKRGTFQKGEIIIMTMIKKMQIILNLTRKQNALFRRV